MRARVGEWRPVPLSTTFGRLRHVDVSCIPADTDAHDGTEIRCFVEVDPRIGNWFLLGVCSPEPGDAGAAVAIAWTAYGDTVLEQIELWRENLLEAALELAAQNWRAATLMSAVAVEVYSAEYLAQALGGGDARVQRAWHPHTIEHYVTAPSGLSVNGRLMVGFQEILGIPFWDTDHRRRWQKLYELRNKLAHGDLAEYRRVRKPSGQRFSDDEDRAHFAYETAIRLIYYMRYYDVGA